MRTIPAADIFKMPHGEHEAMCVTTNGIIKNNGEAVMGRGIAKSVNDRYKVSYALARHLREHGNTPCDLGIHDGFHVLSFPTKHDWRNDSSIQLIGQSAERLMALADSLGLEKIYLTKPGCANGHLDWELQVRPVLEGILDDRFIVILS